MERSIVRRPPPAFTYSSETVLGEMIDRTRASFQVSIPGMFAGAGTNSIMALKNTVLPAMTSTVIKAKFFRELGFNEKNLREYIFIIYLPDIICMYHSIVCRLSRTRRKFNY